MRSRRLMVVVLAACGSASLGALEGRWDVTKVTEKVGSGKPTACAVVVGSSGGNADCSRTTQAAGGSTEAEQLTLRFTVGDDKVEGLLSYVDTLTDACYTARPCTTTITGNARRVGAEDAGPLEAAAGDWTGGLSAEKRCGAAPPRAGSSCAPAAETTSLAAFTFSAHVTGHAARIDWSGDGKSGGLDIAASDTTLKIGDEIYTKQP
jgi:hypothetical protein